MSEIEFRAKTTPTILSCTKDKNGEWVQHYSPSVWVYGYYAPSYLFEQNGVVKNEFAIISDEYIGQPEIISGKINSGLPMMHKVLTDTVGQYTGLKDKNGKKIFEGDIVEFETNVNCLRSELKPYWKDCIEKTYAVGGGTFWVRKDQAIVCWNEKDGMFDLKVYNNKKYKRKSKLFTYRQSGYEVIGNIYDNPELLKGESE